jgi:hypothetical protein
MMRKYKEHIGKKEEKLKNNSPHPTPKKKKQGPSRVRVGPSHWLYEISIFQTYHHHFFPGLIATISS